MTPEESIPTRSARYLYAQSVFYQQFNEVEFFVEDVDQENLYFAILKRLFPKITIAKIFPLGGKPMVIRHAVAHSQNRGSIYIVDKDFTDLLENTTHLPNLFYLDWFCIENYVLEEEPVVRFVMSEKPKAKEANVRKLLAFAAFLAQSMSALQPLFALFLLVQRHQLGVKTTGTGVRKFCEKGTGTISKQRVNAYEQQIRTVSVAKGLTLKPEALNRARADLTPPSHRNVSGKFLLDLLSLHLSMVCGIRSVSTDSLLYRLAEYCDFQNLHPLRDRIANYLRTV
jgi:hypothetical protein